VWDNYLYEIFPQTILLETVQVKRVFSANEETIHNHGVVSYPFSELGGADPKIHFPSARLFPFLIKMGSLTLFGGRDDSTIRIPFLTQKVLDLTTRNTEAKRQVELLKNFALDFESNVVLSCEIPRTKLVENVTIHMVFFTIHKDRLNDYLPVDHLLLVGLAANASKKSTSTFEEEMSGLESGALPSA
jgi:hypothetical protein